MEYTFYKLQIGDKCYVGSTTNLHNRIQKHKSNCNNENDKNYHYKSYQYMRQNGGFENVKVMIIDKIIYNHKREAEEMETKFMLMFNAELNGKYPKRSIKEYREDNKEKIAEYHKVYRENNKEKLFEYNKEWREENKESLVLGRKQYYETNKESLSIKRKEKYEKNREKISEKTKEKIACDLCGKMMRRDSIPRHKKTHTKTFHLVHQ